MGQGNPRPSSDLDLIIVACDPEKYRRPGTWLRDIPFATAAFEIDRSATRAYGDVWSCYVHLEPDAEVELTTLLGRTSVTLAELESRAADHCPV